MHRALKKLLHEARGESGFVVVVFLDIRGFSSWMSDSSQSAIFLKSAYTRILDDFFDRASFFKPTGDGLLVVLEHDERNLGEVLGYAVERSIELVEKFAGITEPDQMVNFRVPEELGIGIARGAATRLVSGNKTLDYSGHPLNLAARLMDLARPSGVVFDSTLGVDLLDKSVRERFTKQPVYIKGLAEVTAMTAYVLKNRVKVPQFNRYPINRFDQHVEATTPLTFKELKERGDFLHPLTREPADPNNVWVFVEHPQARSNGTKHPTNLRSHRYAATIYREAGRQYANIDYNDRVVKDLVSHGVKSTWKCSVWVEYPARPQ